MSCRMASPVESCPGDVYYTSGGTPSINDVRPARRDNVRPPPARRERPKEKGAKGRPMLLAQTIVGTVEFMPLHLQYMLHLEMT